MQTCARAQTHRNTNLRADVASAFADRTTRSQAGLADPGMTCDDGTAPRSSQAEGCADKAEYDKKFGADLWQIDVEQYDKVHVHCLCE